MNKLTIVSVMYLEPEWQETKRCIEATGLPVVYVDRNPAGVGSLAEAINRGFRLAPKSEFIWFVTNITFTPDVPGKLLAAIDGAPSCAGVHPAFNSDHGHIRPRPTIGLIDVPFIEFTAAMVRASLFDGLDERMPYVGHDMAWSYDMRMHGHTVAVLHGTEIGHIYIRHNRIPHPATNKRKRLRAAEVQPTIKRLIERYGPDYKSKIQYHDAL